MIDWADEFRRLADALTPAEPWSADQLTQRLKEDLKRHEGLRLKPYRDTVGKLTIGYGRNLDDRGITEAEADYLLTSDVLDFMREVDTRLPWVPDLDEVRRGVVYNMAFNLGVGGLLSFRNTLAAMQRGDWTNAAEGMLDSLWARQVGRRATELAERMRTGYA